MYIATGFVTIVYRNIQVTARSIGYTVCQGIEEAGLVLVGWF